ncbi:MAG: 3-phosphoshikimate 1-carboxyvinyltransferase [Trueperaceae bacterium]
MQSESERLEIPVAAAPSLEIAVPGSKSLTNRALLVSALAEGRSRLEGALVAEDTDVMKRALLDLGFTVEGEGDKVEVEGLGGKIPSREARLDLRLSGTSIRFLAALVALGKGRFELDGNTRMRERPIGDLLMALNALGANAVAMEGNDCPPLIVEAGGLTGGRAEVAGDRSSQYLSALLMVAPYAHSETVLEVTGELQSKPFIDMTLDLMADFGVEVRRKGYRRFTVPTGGYAARNYRIEGDAMAAGYFWAAAAVTGGRVRVTNLGRASRQGDRRLAEVLEAMGCTVAWGEEWSEVRGPAGGKLRGGSFDLNDMPDQAQTLAAVALFANAPVEITNVWNLRIKETDRLLALANELRKFGAQVEERRDGLMIEPPQRLVPAVVETYGDHRMAMAFAVAGLRVPGTEILDPGCVAKTYPGFFDDFRSLASGGPAL